MSHPLLYLSETSPWRVLSTFLFAITFVLSIAAVVVRLATRLVAGFFPAWGWTTTAILCSSVISVIGKFFYGVMLARAATPVPLAGLLLFALGYTLQSICYRVIFRGSGGEEINLLQAFLIGLMQAVLAVGFVIVILLVLWAVIGPAALKQFSALQNYHPPSMMPARSTRAYSTVAEAQKEAVRRYPLLGVDGSSMNRAYVARYRFYQKTNPAYFSDRSWPLQLADEVANDPAAR